MDIFSRDAVHSRIASKTDRNAVLQLLTSVNILLGFALLLVSCFVSSTWGAGLAFQATSTALCHLAVLIAVFQWLKYSSVQQHKQSVDVVFGAFCVMLLMLLQTYVSWAGLSEGFFHHGYMDGRQDCIVVGRSYMDKPTSVLAGLLFLLNAMLAVLIALWRQDFDSNSEYLPVHTSAGGLQPEVKQTEEL